MNRPIDNEVSGIWVEGSRILHCAYRLLAAVYATQKYSDLLAFSGNASSVERLVVIERGEIERNLLEIAISLRVAMDQGSLRDQEVMSRECGILMPSVSDESVREALRFREACNKIIHVRRVGYHPVHERQPDGEQGRMLRYEPKLTLRGRKGVTTWKALLDLESLVIAVADASTSSI